MGIGQAFGRKRRGGIGFIAVTIVDIERLIMVTSKKKNKKTKKKADKVKPKAKPKKQRKLRWRI